MNVYEAIGTKVKSLSRLVSEIAVVEEEGAMCAYIYPDFDEAERQGIVNLTEEIRWYAVELYNMHAQEALKICAYHVVAHPLPRHAKGIDHARLPEFLQQQEEPQAFEADIDDEIYTALKTYIQKMTDKPVYPSSHFEFDLGLDSLDHVELYAFFEESFGVDIHDKKFAAVMTMERLYRYVKAHQMKMEPVTVDWSRLLRQNEGLELDYSPWMLPFYKAVALPFYKLYFGLEHSGMENIPDGPCIIAPSHQSMLDGFIISATLPYRKLKHTFTMAFEQVFGVTPAARYGQLVLIDVNNDLKAAMQKSAVPLMQGQSLVIFPEGARSRDRQLLEFRPFFAMLAKEFNVPIVPTVLDGTFESLPAGLLFPRPAKVVVKYLEPIYPNEDESAELLTAKVKRRIKEEMEAHPLV